MWLSGENSNVVRGHNSYIYTHTRNTLFGEGITFQTQFEEHFPRFFVNCSGNKNHSFQLKYSPNMRMLSENTVFDVKSSIVIQRQCASKKYIAERNQWNEKLWIRIGRLINNKHKFIRLMARICYTHHDDHYIFRSYEH